MLKNIVPNKAKKNGYRKTRSILTDETIEHKSYRFVALVGYVILGLMFFDYVHLLVPPQLLNPNWELETIGRIIESIWILLLGLMLIFFRPKQKSIKKGELRLLSFLSWMSLFVAICCFLATPLLISNAIRINQTNKAQINAQLTTQNIQVETLLTQVEKATDGQITAFLRSNQLPDNPSSTVEAKEQLSSVIQERQDISSDRLQQRLKNQQVKLFKSTFKWAIGALILGVAFVSVWKYTGWSREIKM